MISQCKILLLLICFSSVNCLAQLDQVRFAETFIESGKYEKALKKLAQIEKTKGASTQLLLLMAKVNMLMGEYQQAEFRLSQVIQNPSIHPDLIIDYADLLIYNDKEKEALEILESFQDYDETIWEHWEQIKKFKPSFDDEVAVQKIAEISSAFADEPIGNFQGELFFRRNGENKGKKEGKFNLFVAKLNSNLQINKYPEEQKRFYKSYHAGRIAFSESGIVAVGAVENNKRKRKKYDRLIFSFRMNDGKYNDWNEMFFSEKAAYNDSDPTISSDGSTVYFASDRPGGYGGYDIYETNYIDGTWQNPRNLGPKINTTGDDRYPYFYKNAHLYFSSDGSLGYGGLDIYKFNLASNGQEKELLPLPINSIRDDYAYTLLKNESFVFSSNRSIGSGQADVYGVVLSNLDEPKMLNFRIQDISSDAISNASVSVINILNGTEYLYQSDLQGNFDHFLVEGKELNVRVSHPNYIKLEKRININETVNPIVLTMTAIVKEDWTIINDLKFGLGNSQILETETRGLKDIIMTLKQNSNLKVAFRGHTDSQGDKELNWQISKRRLAEVKDYLVDNGIEKKRISVFPMGETELLNHCSDGIPCSEEEHAINRRIDYQFTKDIEVTEFEADELSNENDTTYKVQIGAFSHLESLNTKMLENVGKISLEPTGNGVTRVLIGAYNSEEKAQSTLILLQNIGYKDAYIQKYQGTKRID